MASSLFFHIISSLISFFFHFSFICLLFDIEL